MINVLMGRCYGIDKQQYPLYGEDERGGGR